MEMEPEDYIDGMVLTQTEIDNGEALEVAIAPAVDLVDAAEVYAQFRAIVPESVLDMPQGSRGDIEQAAVWADGTWHTEFRRALVTENDDDVQYDDVVKTYRFSIAIMDNHGGEDHSPPGTETFLLSLYVPPVSYEVSVGPIRDSDGEPVEGAEVRLNRNITDTITGVTDMNGTLETIVPPQWADSTVYINISKEGFLDLSFVGSINDVGGFSPMDGTYPKFIQEGELDEDETPGPGSVPALLALLIAATAITLVVANMNRREMTRGRP
jgi:hypothetical protein